MERERRDKLRATNSNGNEVERCRLQPCFFPLGFLLLQLRRLNSHQPQLAADVFHARPVSDRA